MTIEFQHDLTEAVSDDNYIPPEILQALKRILEKSFYGVDFAGSVGLMSNKKNELWILVITENFLYQLIIGENRVISKGLDFRLFQKIDTIKSKHINEVIYQLVFRDYTICLSCPHEDIVIPEFVELLENRCNNIIDSIIRK